MHHKAKQPRPWLRLDNAAKIFPPSSTKHDTNVFRFVAVLNAPVDPVLLQYALDRTLERFPFYLSMLRRGFFWFYFERGSFAPKVHEENRPVCPRLYDPNIKSLLFDVSYFRNRINLEVFHALSDGTGGMDFLRSLLVEYLSAEDPSIAKQNEAEGYSVASPGWEDSFARHYEDTKPARAGGQSAPIAYQEKGKKMPERRLNILDAHLSVTQSLGRAKYYGVSLTIYLAAALIRAYGKTMREKDIRRPISLAVPVNLRNYFPSDSARNFFSLIHVRYRFTLEEWHVLHDGGGEEESDALFRHLLDAVRDQFANELTQQKLASRIHELGKLERNPFIRVIPLFIKNLILGLANDFSQLGSTTTLSNLSVFTLPPSCCPHVHSVMAMTSTDNSQICICSFQDVLSITFTSINQVQDVRKHFLRFLSQDGLDISLGTPPPLGPPGKRVKAQSKGKANPDPCPESKKEARARRNLIRQERKLRIHFLKRETKAKAKQLQKDVRKAER